MLNRSVHRAILLAAFSVAATANAQSGAVPQAALIAQAPQQQPGAPAQPYNPPPSARSANRDLPPEQFKVGDTLPTEFRNNQFVVENLQLHELPKPKAGTRWVGVGPDYLRVDRRNKIVEVRHWREARQ